MTADELRALQAPIKERYKADPASALVTHRAVGRLIPDRVACEVEGGQNPILAGLNPAAGGDGSWACSAEILLQSLVACAGVTACAVATAMSIPLRGGTVTAEGDLDYRGTLGVSREVPVGISAVRLHLELDSDASPEQLDKLRTLVERYCVVARTLTQPPTLHTTLTAV